MYQYISELRKKPDHHKRRFALLASGAITGMIFIAWLSVLLPQNANQIIAEERSSSSNVTPISSLKSSVAQVVTAARELFTETTSTLDFESEYNKMKAQVESGEIKFVPEDPRISQ
jgi:cytoskeletal protein RodZ